MNKNNISLTLTVSHHAECVFMRKKHVCAWECLFKGVLSYEGIGVFAVAL